MPEKPSVRDLLIARLYAATELTKVATAGATVKDLGTPRQVADRAKLVGQTFDIILKAIIKAGC